MTAIKDRRHQATQRGFTLIELMIVVVIIGVLAALALPRFSIASMRTKEREADLILKKIYTSQQAYQSQNGTYAETVLQLQSVGFLAPPPGQLKHYTWGGDASIAPPVCLQSNGDHSNRTINFATGTIGGC